MMPSGEVVVAQVATKLASVAASPPPIKNPYSRTMGIQSQNRGGSVKACKKRGTKAKRTLHQIAIPGGTLFKSAHHCSVCKAERLKIQGHNVNIPHRSHHPRCGRNIKTRGLSASTVMANKEVARNLMINNAGMNTVLGRQLNSKMPSVHPFFRLPNPQLNPQERQVSQEQLSSPPNDELITAKMDSNGDDSEQQTKDKAAPIAKAHDGKAATSLRTIIDQHLKAYQDNDPDYAWVGKCKYPIALTCAIGYVVSLFKHKKKKETNFPLPQSADFVAAIEKYHMFFPPGTCSFTFPPDDNNLKASPDYHSIIGESFLYLDWKLLSPSIELYCLTCFVGGTSKEDCWLEHCRTNWSKNKHLFPVWTSKGRPTLAVVMQYKCPVCDVIIAANDGRLLMILPASLRQVYPADPKYCGGTFHFDMDLTDDLESLMKTYANAGFVGRKLVRKLGLQYSRRVEAYLSLCPVVPYISFEDFKAGISPPSATNIRRFFVDGFYSPLTPYGYSQYDRIVCEMQNVTIAKGDAIACDWTFQVAKNYNLKDAKAIFTANVGRTNEIFTLAIVSSTAISQVSHMLIEIMKKRRNFDPAVLYHDTCPNNSEFWKTLFGSHVEVRLGLFHLLHRIVDTLDNKSEWYWKGLVDLKRTIYKYNSNDYTNLLEAMQNGKFDRLGTKYSEMDILHLQESKGWKERCDPFLRKEINDGRIIGQGIAEWIRNYKEKGITDGQGRPLFTRNTEKIAKEQIGKVQWVADPPGLMMYREIPAGKKSTHQLPKWLSNRPESGLEKFHELLANMANTGSGKELADALTLAGTGDHNNKARWKEYVNNKKLSGVEIPGTVEYEDEPPFWDHSYLDLLNRKAESLGMDHLFRFVTPPSQDNGEVFLSKYFEQQQERTKKGEASSTDKFCSCPSCRGYVPPVNSSPEQAEASNKNDTQQRSSDKEQQWPHQQLHSNQSGLQQQLAEQLPTWAPTRAQQLPTIPWQIAPRQQVAQPWQPPLAWPTPPFKPCFDYFPFYCPPKRQYYDNKMCGQGRAGRPPKCASVCVSQR